MGNEGIEEGDLMIFSAAGGDAGGVWEWEWVQMHDVVRVSVLLPLAQVSVHSMVQVVLMETPV